MRGKSVGLAQRKAHPAADAEPFLGLWEPAFVAPVFSALLSESVRPEQLRRRAVALGLANEPPDGQPCQLTARALSRLFLAGYRLPAQVEHGSADILGEHLRAQRHVFVLLDGLFTDRGFGTESRGLYRLIELGTAAVGSSVLMSTSGSTENGSFRLPQADFFQTWADAGYLLIAAARDWGELPSASNRFFAGGRGKDGVLHWDTAECDTSARGEILR